jgi:hypothetical protein
MSDITVLAFPEITEAIQNTDILYWLRGTGNNRDRKSTADKFIPIGLSITGTSTLDLSNYFSDVVAFIDTAGITVTISNELPVGRSLIVINKSSGDITLTGIINKILKRKETIYSYSDGTQMIESLITNISKGSQSFVSRLGNDLNIPGIGSIYMTAMSPTRIAFIENISGDLRTYDFDGNTGNWSQVGNLFSVSGSGNLFSLTALSSSRIALTDNTNKKLRTYDFDGTDWSLVGNELTITGALTPVVTALSSSSVAFFDGGNDDLRTYDFDGTDWSQVGNDLNISGAGSSSITALSSSRIAFFDYSTDILKTYDFDSNTGDWSQVGNDLSVSAGSTTITALSSSRIAFIDDTDYQLRIYEFNDINWSQISNDFDISTITPSTGLVGIAALSSSRIAYTDPTNEDLRVYSSIFEENPPSPAF